MEKHVEVKDSEERKGLLFSHFCYAAMHCNQYLRLHVQKPMVLK